MAKNGHWVRNLPEVGDDLKAVARQIEQLWAEQEEIRARLKSSERIAITEAAKNWTPAEIDTALRESK